MHSITLTSLLLHSPQSPGFNLTDFLFQSDTYFSLCVLFFLLPSHDLSIALITVGHSIFLLFCDTTFSSFSPRFTDYLLLILFLVFFLNTASILSFVFRFVGICFWFNVIYSFQSDIIQLFNYNQLNSYLGPKYVT